MPTISSLSQLASYLDQSTEYDNREIKRGEIYYVDLEDIAFITKHIANKTRPALVIQNDVGNARGSTIIVALLTTTQKRPYPFQYHVPVNGKESVIMFEQILTVDKNRVLEKLGELTSEQMKEAEHALLYSLQLNPLSLENVIDIEVMSLVTRKTRLSEDIYFEIDIIFSNSRRSLHIPLSRLERYDHSIGRDISFDELKQKLDCCHGLNWLVNNSEI